VVAFNQSLFRRPGNNLGRLESSLGRWCHLRAGPRQIGTQSLGSFGGRDGDGHFRQQSTKPQTLA